MYFIVDFDGFPEDHHEFDPQVNGFLEVAFLVSGCRTSKSSRCTAPAYDMIADFPVLLQYQGPTIQAIQKTVESRVGTGPM